MSGIESEATLAWVRRDTAPVLPPPPNSAGLSGWMVANLFSTWYHAIITVVLGMAVVSALLSLYQWAAVEAVWTGVDRSACIDENADGACWPFVTAKFGQWIYGFYPFEERWRVNIVYLLGILLLVPLLMPSLPYKRENAVAFFGVFPLVALILLTGGNFNVSGGTWLSLFVLVGILAAVLLFLSEVALIIERAAALKAIAVTAAVVAVILLVLDLDFGLAHVETSKWGGLLVTLVVAVTGIVASLPLGILLALGRRSKMPVVKLFSVMFIELWRGVPLITVLFMASVMLPLFLPDGVNFDKLLRVLIGVALFSAAYMAEVVRGGLQAIPKGQYEAANALGLPYWSSMGLIVLPQALKIVIPGIVNTFIGLFKDTTLVLIIGLYDLLGIVQAGMADGKWASPQTAPTGYFSAALIFWVFCFGMSRYSMFMERRLATGHKR